jgi:hypothetical protein
MFRRTAITAGLGLALTTTVQAQDAQQQAIVTGDKLVDTYRWELNADYTRGEWSANGIDDTETDEFTVGGSFYFKPVDTTIGPRGEAAFLDQASDITLSYTYGEVDDNGIDIDSDSYLISGRYVMDVGLILEGAYRYYEPVNAEVDQFRLSAGYYLTDTTTIIVDYLDSDVDDGGSFPEGVVEASDTDGWNARVEHFWSFSGQGGLKLEGNYGFINVDDADDVDLWGLGATWYITRDIGIGATYENTDYGILESDDYGLFAEWFVTRNIAVNLAYSHREPDDFDIDSDIDFPGDDDINRFLRNSDLEFDAITLGATLRF